MDPIQAISELTSGDVIHHPALGFAVVDRVDGSAATLAWEQDGPRLPPIVSQELLAKGYRRCTPGGFLQQSVLSHQQLEVLVKERPAAAVRMLVDELGEGLGRAEIHDWMTGRELVQTTQFDRWWAHFEEAVTGEPGLQWGTDHATVDLVQPEGAVDSESFLASTPRLRFQIASSATPETRDRLLLQAITARDTLAILLLLRVHTKIPEKARRALRKLALDGNYDVSAALLASGDAHLLSKLVVPAGRSGRRLEVSEVLSRLPPSIRRAVAARIIEEALTIEGDPPAASWLCSEVAGGIHALLEAAYERGDCPQAIEWLQEHSRTDPAGVETVNDELSGMLGGDTLITTSSHDNNESSHTLLSQLRDLPTKDLFSISCALARALALRHAQGERGGITGARLTPRNEVELGPQESTDPQSDVHDAMRLVLEAAVGPLPQDRPVQDDHLLGHAHILRKDLPLDWMAVCAKAMATDPAQRHSDGVDLWAHLARAEANHSVRSQTPQHPHQRLQVAHDTHIGLMKSRLMQTNQDAVFYAQAAHLSLLLVCDGISVSTAGSGNLASALCVKAVAGCWERDMDKLLNADEATVLAWLQSALIAANSSICEASEGLADGHLEQHIPMGTTAVLTLAQGNTLQIASLGDSRAYLIGASGVALLTGDQNVRSMWLEAARRGERFEMGNEGYALSGYCGRFNEHLKPSPAAPVLSSLKMLPGEVLLLCSDGLTDYAGQSMAETSEIIAAGAAAEDLGQGCRELVDTANAAGGGDNITVLLARLES
jgi:protein phosphatase